MHLTIHIIVCGSFTTRFAPSNRGFVDLALSMCGIFIDPGGGGFLIDRADTIRIVYKMKNMRGTGK